MRNAVDEIKSRLDIVEVIKDYTALKQMGTNWKGLCPFHNEKTPSFMVSQDKQVWHCFGCSEGGDIFTFIEKIENVDFREALRILAQKANVQLPEYNPKEVSLRSTLLDIHAVATTFYQKQLFSERGTSARDYIKKRGLDKNLTVQWKVGYAPEEWDALTNYLKSKKFTQEELLQSGLVIKNNERNSVYDRFRDRIMFPITDHNGQVIGFSGRLLNPEGQGGKYVNSPQSPLYDKSAVLFGLSQARNAIKQYGHVVLVEGQMDVISSHKAQVAQVVASSGTALTEQQLELLQRYTKTLIVAYDQDSAGVKALERSIMLALQFGFEIKVIVLPDGHDPDSLIQDDVERWGMLLQKATTFMDYYFNKAADMYDLTTIDGKKQATKMLLPVIAAVRDKVEQDLYIQRLSGLISVAPHILYESLPKQQKQNKEAAVPATQPQPVKNTTERQYQRFLACLLLRPEIVLDLESPEEYIQSEPAHTLYKELVLFYTNRTKQSTVSSDSDWTSEFEDLLTARDDSRLVTFLNALKLLSEDLRSQDIHIEKEIEKLVLILKKDYLQKRITELQRQLAQNDSDEKVLQELNTHIKALAQL